MSHQLADSEWPAQPPDTAHSHRTRTDKSEVSMILRPEKSENQNYCAIHRELNGLSAVHLS